MHSFKGKETKEKTKKKKTKNLAYNYEVIWEFERELEEVLGEEC